MVADRELIGRETGIFGKETVDMRMSAVRQARINARTLFFNTLEESFAKYPNLLSRIPPRILTDVLYGPTYVNTYTHQYISSAASSTLVRAADFAEWSSLTLRANILEAIDRNRGNISTGKLHHMANIEGFTPTFSLYDAKSAWKFMQQNEYVGIMQQNQILAVFELAKPLYYNVPTESSTILFGNKDSRRIWKPLVSGYTRDMKHKAHPQDEENFGLAFLRLNPARAHKPDRYCYVWLVQTAEEQHPLFRTIADAGNISQKPTRRYRTLQIIRNLENLSKTEVQPVLR